MYGTYDSAVFVQEPHWAYVALEHSGLTLTEAIEEDLILHTYGGRTFISLPDVMRIHTQAGNTKEKARLEKLIKKCRL